MARNAAKSDDDAPDLGIPNEDPNVTVDLTPDDDDDDVELLEGGKPQKTGGDEEPRQRDPATGKWSKNKSERGRNNREQQNWRAEKAEMEARFTRQQAESDRRFQEMQARIDANLRAGGGQQQAQDPFAAKFAALDAQLSTELQLIEKDEKRDYKRYNELRREETRLVAQQEAYRGQQEQRRNAPQPNPQNEQYAVRRQLLVAEHPWLSQEHTRPLADKAWAIRNSLIAVEGMPDSIDTDRQALLQAIARFGAEYGLRQPAPPSQRTRNLYAGPASGTGPSRGAPPSEIELPKTLVNGSGLSPQALRAALRDIEG